MYALTEKPHYAAFRKTYRSARENGYAVNAGHTQKGATAFAIPLFGEEQAPIGAVAVASVSEQMDAMRREQIVEICRRPIALVKNNDTA